MSLSRLLFAWCGLTIKCQQTIKKTLQTQPIGVNVFRKAKTIDQLQPVHNTKRWMIQFSRNVSYKSVVDDFVKSQCTN